MLGNSEIALLVCYFMKHHGNGRCLKSLSLAIAWQQLGKLSSSYRPYTYQREPRLTRRPAVGSYISAKRNSTPILGNVNFIVPKFSYRTEVFKFKFITNPML